MASNVLHEDGSAKDLRVEKLVQVSRPLCPVASPFTPPYSFAKQS